MRLDKFHRMFQAAMGWEDCHLHSFEICGERYGMQFDDYPEGELDEKAFTVVAAVGTNERFTYEYDFGDSWEHEITVHRVSRMAKGLKSPSASTAPTRVLPRTSVGRGATSTCSPSSLTLRTRSTSTSAAGSVARSIRPSSTWPW